MKITMKNLLLTFIFCFSFLAVGTSQVSFGGGVAYQDDFGVQARAAIDMESFTIIPKFTYYFVDIVTLLVFDADVAFNVAEIDENPVYLFAGPSLNRVSGFGSSSSEIGLNLGAGARFSNLYVEAKYALLFCDGCGGDIGVAAGYMF